MSARRWVATVVGFVGVMIMVRPGHSGFDPVALIAVVSARTFAVANVMIRMMSDTEPPNRILFYYHAGGTVIFLGESARLVAALSDVLPPGFSERRSKTPGVNRHPTSPDWPATDQHPPL